MTMRFDFADFSRRFSLNDILRPMSIAEERQAEIDRQKAAYFARGSTITVLPGVEFKPRPEAQRKPHPEKLIRQTPKARQLNFAGSRTVPAGLIPIGKAAIICGMSQTNSKQLGYLRKAIEAGRIKPDFTGYKGDKPIYYFWPETAKAFYAVAGEKWWLKTP